MGKLIQKQWDIVIIVFILIALAFFLSASVVVNSGRRAAVEGRYCLVQGGYVHYDQCVMEGATK